MRKLSSDIMSKIVNTSVHLTTKLVDSPLRQRVTIFVMQHTRWLVKNNCYIITPFKSSSLKYIFHFWFYTLQHLKCVETNLTHLLY